MKATTLGLILGFGVGAIAPISASAAIRTHSINRVEHRQQVRIRQGIRSGELTRTEAGRLEAEQAKIRLNQRFARADGNITPNERQRLHKELYKASHDIYHQKHDDQDRN